jgi:dienelactone hydrolase
MISTLGRLLVSVTTISAAATMVLGDSLPTNDTRAAHIQDVNTPRTFPTVNSKSEWQARAREIRENTLVSCGLWPMPDKTPLNAKIFGKIERDGYSIEKVYFESYPGFFVAGNLYRPVGKGNGPFPAVLNPHGHWPTGRFQDDETVSHAGRCINFAKQGMVAFSWDLVGYNDTMQLGAHRKFFLQPELELWNISLMGLQSWNGIRALDFLCSLPDVDVTRTACTGESGGGTQTFMLGAMDDRLAAQAPVVMVSHIMQGGCQCENAPGLRVDHFNVEIAGVAAPRPQILVACTGDWTKSTMTVEGPALDHIYSLFKAPEKIHYEIFEFKHNYNKTSREAVYPWFGKWLLHNTDPSAFKEAAFTKEPNQDLRVFPDGRMPAEALDEQKFIKFLKDQTASQLEALKPYDKKSLAHWKEIMSPAWRHSLQVELPEKGLLVEFGDSQEVNGCTMARLFIGRSGKGDRIPVILVTPRKDSAKSIVILANAQGKAAYLDASGAPVGLAKKLVDRGLTVLLLDTFLTGDLANPAAAKGRRPFEKFFTTYNRTDLQERVQDLITACAFANLHSKLGRRPAILCGQGRAGLWALLAAPVADAVVADCDSLDSGNDGALLTSTLFSPGLRRIGGFDGAASLAAPNPLILHNTGERFSTAWIEAAYAASSSAKSIRADPARLEDDALAGLIVNLKTR